MIASSSDPSSSEVTLALPDVPVETDEKCHNTKPIRLLSLDGGGIRGISSILILKDVMRQVNKDRKDELEPWQVFDLIGGTSTGGIIAIMLGSLRMTLDECHEAYIKLAKTIFKPKRCKFNVFSRGLDFISANERYDSEKFEQVVKAIIARRKGSSSARLHNPADNNCRVFVTTVQADENELVLLRSYDNPQQLDKLSPQLEMWEALRATSAATTYFKEFRRGDMGFVDGAFKSNNPVFQVYHEGKDLWPGRPAFVVSIGTGTKPSVPLRGHALQLARTLTKLVTETEETWNRFNRGNKDMLDANMLFRYSVPEIGCIDLGDHGQLSTVESSTNRWLRSPSAAKYVSACAHKVREIQTTDYAKLEQEARERESQSKSSLLAEEKECLKTLHRGAPDYESQRLIIEKPVPGTCEWFLKHPRFVDWLEKPASMLWLTANPGCGKSVLSNYLVERAPDFYGKNAIVCSFFFKAGEESRREAHHALCSLLHQTLSLNPSLAKLATAELSHKDSSAFMRNIEGLWKLLLAAAGKLGTRKLICVVDALDECMEGSRNRLCGLLRATFGHPETNKTPQNLKFLVTSRPWPSLESQMRPLVAVRFRGEDESHALARDLEQMVQYKVDQLRQDSALSEEAALLLHRKLLRGADQTFLWVSLVLERVADMPSRKLSAIEHLLSTLPVGLDKLYESALDTFERPGESFKLLEFLVAGERDFTVDEINIALNITDNTQSLDQLHGEMEPDIEWTVKRLGGFFVRISNSTVSLVHQTAREFLSDLAAKKTSEAASYRTLDIKRANVRLGASCTRFLLLRGFPPRTEAIQLQDGDRLLSNQAYLDSCPGWTRRFLEYASKHWARHLRDEMFDHESTLWSLVTQLCKAGSMTFNRWWTFYVGLSWTFCLAPHLMSAEFDQYCRVRVDRFPAHYAAYQGDSPIVLALLRSGTGRADEGNDSDVSLLAVASMYRHNAKLVERLLVQLEANKNAEELIGGALLVALEHGHNATVRALVAAGVDPNKKYRTTLRGPERSGGFPVDVLLRMSDHIEYSPTLEVLCQNGLIVLDAHVIAAASEGSKMALGILLDHDRRPMEAQLPGLQEAFRVSVENGWPGCRQVLLQRFGNLVDIDVSRGLKSATARHDPEALHGILDLGAQDDGGALQSACETANEDTTRQLLEAQPYSAIQLNSSIAAYFDSVNDPDMRRYQERMALKAIESRTRLYQSFKITSTFGLTMGGKYAVLSMLSQRGARTSESRFISAFAVVVPMDEDFATYLLDNIGQLQDDAALCPDNFLVLSCLWGRERLVKRILDNDGPETDVWVGNSLGISPLLAAAVSGNIRVVELLLSRGAQGKTSTSGPAGRDTSTAACMIDKEVGIWWKRVVQTETSKDPMLIAKTLGLDDVQKVLLNHSQNA